MSNDRIVVLRPDKGSGVVIMNKDDYLNKMYEALSDNKRFLPDIKSKVMTHQTGRSVCQLISKLLQDEVIDLEATICHECMGYRKLISIQYL